MPAISGTPSAAVTATQMRRQSRLLPVLLRSTAIVMVASSLAHAALGDPLPQGGVVRGGQATITTSGSHMDINASTNRTVIDWNSFSIGADGSVNFRLPGSNAIAVNRVTGTDPSQIFGQLTSNGQIVITNPYGIWFGANAHVDVAGIVATTGRLSDSGLDTFVKGGVLNFEAAGAATASIINQGSITVADGGLAAFVAPGVRNEGTITARLGRVELASGTTATLDFYGDGLINLAVGGKVTERPKDQNGANMNAAVENKGKIIANGGSVRLSANVAKGVVDNVIDMSGVVEATGVTTRGGVVELLGGDGAVAVSGTVAAGGEGSNAGGQITVEAGDAAGHGTVAMSGTLDASSHNGAGGKVEVSARMISHTGTIKADGASGGAVVVKVGGITQSGSISANGSAGKGGNVAVNTTYNITQTTSATISVNGSTDAGTISLDGGINLFTSGKLMANGAQGGTISLLGDSVTLAAAQVNASGTFGGGIIDVGGSLHGAGTHLADLVTVNPSASLVADAIDSGKGGQITLWSQKKTVYQGSISARGGAHHGDGGLVEVSSKGEVAMTGSVDAAASFGAPGTLLLDPKNIIIDDSAGGLAQYDLIDPNPKSGCGSPNESGCGFGGYITPLSNGIVVVTKPYDKVAGLDNAGSVYFYDPSTGGLVGTLQGSHENDMVGDRITFLNYEKWRDFGYSSNYANVTEDTAAPFLIFSSNWNDHRGAITKIAAGSAINGIVSSSNSLVGGSVNDFIGTDGTGTFTYQLLPGTNNFVIASQHWGGGKGALTFGTKTGLLIGVVDSSNSLVGSHADPDANHVGDRLGSAIQYPTPGNLFLLSNGNFVVSSPNWNGGAGAITFGTRDGGLPVGVLSSSNSLVGGTAGVAYSSPFSYSGTSGTRYGWYGGDGVGSGSVPLVELPNGDFAIVTPSWSHDRGAVTIGNKTTGVTGVVSAANSLVGTTPGIGDTSDGTGNSYYTSIYGWRGYYGGDRVGGSGITGLTSGAWVIGSSNWDQERGAATYIASGTTSLGTGSGTSYTTVSFSNSLTGMGQSTFDYDSSHQRSSYREGDAVGATVTALANGNYVVASTEWNANSGAVTLMNGTTGKSVLGSNGSVGDTVSSVNSLVGSSMTDNVGLVTVLTGTSNFVVSAYAWGNGKGSVTYVNGTTGSAGGTGLLGAISATNSLVGTKAYTHATYGGDNVGSSIIALANGGWVIGSPYWSTGKGAVTYVAPGAVGPVGTISAANSLIGTTSGTVYQNSCPNGSLQYCTHDWQLFGGDQLGVNGIQALSNSNFLIYSSQWSTNRGAVTFVNGTTGKMANGADMLGSVSALNSLVGFTPGTVATDRYGKSYYYGGDNVGYNGINTTAVLGNGNFIVSNGSWSLQAGAVTFGNGTTGTFGNGSAFLGMIGSSNSLVGSNQGVVTPVTVWTGYPDQTTIVGGDRIGMSSNANIVELAGSNYLVLARNWNNDRGSVTWGSATTGVSGTVASNNSLVGSHAGDQVGSDASGSMVAQVFADGRYAIGSPSWNNGRGAITLGTSSTALIGELSSSNSFVGAADGDMIGSGVSSYYFGTGPGTGSISWMYGSSAMTGNGNILFANDLYGGVSGVSWTPASGAYTGTASSLNMLSGATNSASQVLATSDASMFLMARSGEGSGRVTVADTDPTIWLFNRARANTVTIAPSLITAALNSGTSIVLQASNDLTINSSLIAAANSTASLRLDAGRSILVHADVSTGLGNLILVANAGAAQGVINAQRDAGAAVIALDATTTLSGGVLMLTLAKSTDKTYNATGNVTLGNLSGTTVTVLNQGSTGNLTLGGTITATGSGNSVVLATPGNFINNTGATAISPGAGRYLVYSADPRTNTLNGLTPSGKLYDSTYSANLPHSLPATGNLMLYSVAPTLTVTASGNIGYGTTLSALTPSATGLIDGDTIATAISGTPTYSSAYVAGNAVGNTYAVTVGAGSVFSPLGYHLVFADGSMTVVPQVLTVSLVNSASKIYDGSNSATLSASNYHISGLYGSDSISVTKQTGTYGSVNAGSGLTVSTTLASGDFTLGSGTVSSNYVLPTGVASGNIGTITPKTLTATLTGSISKTYNGTNAATLTGSNYQLAGFISGQSATVTKTSGTFSSVNVGSGLTVTASLSAGDFTAGSGTSLSNYTLPTSASGSIGTIARASLTATLTGTVSKTYDGNNTATLAGSNYQLTGLASGESISVTKTAGTYGSTNAASGLTVSTTLASGDFTAGSGTLLSNYDLPTGAVSGNIGTITPKALTIALTGTTSKTYDGANSATLTGSNYQLSGLVSGQSISVTKTSGTYASTDVASGLTVSTSLITSDFTAGSGTSLSNYVLPTSASGSIGDITKRMIFLNLVGTTSKTYDGTATATLTDSNVQVGNLVSGQSITVSITSGSYNGANVGSGIWVSAFPTLSDYTAGAGTLLSNYQLGTVTGGAIGTITPKTLTIGLTGTVSKTYNGNNSAYIGSDNYQLNGLVGSDSFWITQSSGTYASVNAGTGIAVSTTLATSDFFALSGTASNYILPTGALSGAVGTITPKTLTASLTGTTTKTYNGSTAATLSQSNYQISGLISGQSITVSNTSGTYSTQNAGTSLAVSTTLAAADFSAGSGTLLSNYVLPVSASGNIGAITPAALTIALTGSTTKTYDGSTTATLASANYQLSGLISGDSITVGKTSGTYASANAASGLTVSTALAYADFIADTGTRLANYVLPTSVSGAIGTITPAALTVVLTGTAAKTYNGSNAATLSADNYQLSGLVSGQSVSINQTSGTYATANAGSGLTVSATLVASDFAAGSDTLLSNYVLPVSASGSIGTITPATLTIVLTGATSKTYDGNAAATLTGANYQIAGLVSGESLSVGKTSGTYASANAGNGLTVSTALESADFAAGAGTLLSNYVLPVSASGAIGTITPRALTASLIGATSKVYDGNTAATLTGANYQLGNLVDGESVGISQTNGTYASKDVANGLTVSATLASSDFTAGAGTLLSNYVLPVSASGSIGTITPATLTIVLTGATSKTYDGNAAATLTGSNYQIGGLVSGESLSVGKTSGTYATVNAGNGLAVTTALAFADFAAGAGTLLSNYVLPVSASGTIGTITPRALTASLIGATSKVYDGNTAATLTGANYQLGNLVDGESVGISQTNGIYASKDVAGGLTVSATLASSDFTAGAGTLLSNYVLPVSASGSIGTITPATLTIVLTGATSKTYDGNAAATLTGSNYQIAGLVSGESLSVGKTSGTYATVNAGNGLAVSTALAFADFAAGAGTLLSNYVLPVSASGTIGTISQRALTVTLIGESAKTFDNSDVATLTGANYQISGLLDGESISISKTTGAFSATVPDKLVLVTASLTPGDYVAGPGTQLANYALPTFVSGTIGTIKPIPTAITAAINVMTAISTAPSAPPPPPPPPSAGSAPQVSATFGGALSTSFLPQPVTASGVAGAVQPGAGTPPPIAEQAVTTTGTGGAEAASSTTVAAASSGDRVAANIASATPVDGNSDALLGRSGGNRDVHDYANRYLSSIGLGGLQ